jgi:hypothetical protein
MYRSVIGSLKSHARFLKRVRLPPAHQQGDRKKGQIPLSTTTPVSEGADALTLHIGTPGRVYVIRCEIADEATAWIDAIKKQITALASASESDAATPTPGAPSSSGEASSSTSSDAGVGRDEVEY